MKSQLLFLILTVLLVQPSWAQVDPATGLLLAPAARPSVRDSGLDSGRYTVRPKGSEGTVRAKKVVAEEATSETESETKEQQVTANTHAASPAALASASGASATSSPDGKAGASSERNQTPLAATAPSPTPASPSPTASPSSAQAPSTAAAERTAGHLLDLSFGGGYLYNDSNSDFGPRKYSTSSPTFGFDAKVWLEPGTAFHAAYTSSLSGSVNDSNDHSKSVNLTQQWYQVGFRGRHSTGRSSLAPVLEFGLDYEEYAFQVPADASQRIKMKTSAGVITLLADLPQGNGEFSQIGFELLPKAQHTELASATQLKSGSNVDANAVGFFFGKRYLISRTSSLYWRMSERVERDLFSGTAGIDSSTGLTPSGVSVTNSFTMFQFGFVWGE